MKYLRFGQFSSLETLTSGPPTQYSGREEVDAGDVPEFLCPPHTTIVIASDQSYKVFRPRVGRPLDRNEKLLRGGRVADTSLLSLHSDKTPS